MELECDYLVAVGLAHNDTPQISERASQFLNRVHGITTKNTAEAGTALFV